MLCGSFCYIPPITRLFNLSLSSSARCTHLFKPIFKSGDRTDVSNYRPIALLPVVLERVVYNHLFNHVGCRISPSQFGFMPSRSTIQQLLVLLSDIYSALDKKSSVEYISLVGVSVCLSMGQPQVLWRGTEWSSSRQYFR